MRLQRQHQVGLSDGVVSVLQGISNDADNVVAKTQLRPRRALELTPGTSTSLAVLVPYSQEAAEAQVCEPAVRGSAMARRGSDALARHSVY
jgi:hypothetical protein